MHARVADDLAGGSREAVSPLAVFLYGRAGAESVRTREAIAATIMNQVKRLSIEPDNPQGSDLLLEHLGRLNPTASPPPRVDDPGFASCLRIAQRAISGALKDITRGALRFHEIGINVAWASALSPVAWIGSYLFYGEDVSEHAREEQQTSVDPPIDGEAGIRDTLGRVQAVRTQSCG